ncbi:MAG: hypothetical protein KDA25_09470 [Phycisphaerales bacterium]|nr:hypothetical protein [Phycisphaerales bacterium]
MTTDRIDHDAAFPDIERALYEELVTLCADRATRERDITSTYDETRRQATTEYETATKRLDDTFEREMTSLAAQYESTRAARTAAYDDAVRRLVESERDATERILEKAETNEKTAQKRLQEAIWLTETVFEETEDQPRDEHEAAQKILDAKAQELLAVRQDAMTLTKGFRVPLGPDPGRSADDQPVPEGVDHDRGLRDAARTAQDHLERLRSIGVVKLFRLPILLALIVLILGAGVAGVASLRAWQFTTPVIGLGAGLGAVVLLVGYGALFVAIRSRMGSIARAIDASLLTAHVMHRGAVGAAATTRVRREQEMVARRDHDVREANEKLGPVIERIQARRDHYLGKIKRDHATRREEIDGAHAADTETRDRAYHEATAARKAKYEAARRTVQERFDATMHDNEARHAVEWTTLEERWTTTMNRLHATIEALDRRSAALFPPWAAPSWTNWDPPTELVPIIRIGRFEIDMASIEGGIPEDERLVGPWPTRFELPAVLRFPDQWSMLLQTDEHGRDEAIRTLQLTMLRLLTTLPPGKVRFTIIDPVGLGQNFAGFMHLADHEEAFVADKIWTETRHIEQRLTDLTEHMENVIQKYLRNDFASIADYNEHAGEIAEPYRFLVIADFPANFSEVAAKRLASIVNSGARCGVHTLIHFDRRNPIPPGVQLADLEQHGVNLVYHDGRLNWMQPTFESLRLTIDPIPDEAFMTETMHIIGRAAKERSRVQVPFSFVTPSTPEEMWSLTTDRELRVPLGRAGATKLQYLTLGPGTSQHALIAGKTGSGKSTLLHVLITTLSMWYSPDEVEFYLVDFKKGVEFKTYATHRLPHARVVGIESDREFGLSVLQRLDDELKHRGNRFRDLGVQDLAGYRRIPDQPAMPRVLLIVDEFQELFVEDDRIGQDASMLLDRLVRQGRAFGIHVLLGSQTLGGAYSLARSTMGQMTVRVALQCSEADSYLILNEDNSAARLLARPGEAIYNDQSGLVEGNSPFQIVWLSERDREEALHSVQAYADTHPTEDRGAQITFEGNIPARIEDNQGLARLLDRDRWPERVAVAQAWLGDAISIKDPTSVDFRRQGGSNLVIVGQNELMALSIITSSVLSLAAQHAAGALADDPAGPRFYLFDGTTADSPFVNYLERFETVLPHFVQLVGWRDVPNAMTELAREYERRQSGDLTDAPPVYTFVFGLQRFRDLRRSEDDYGFASSDGPPSPAKQMADLIREGPGFGMHMAIWADALGSLNRSIERQSLREFENRVLFQMSSTDSTNLIDHTAAAKLGMNRALFYSEEQGIVEKFRPYALPDDAWFESVRDRLHGRLGASRRG